MDFFDEDYNLGNPIATGIDFKLKRMDLDNKRLKIQIWDPFTGASMRFMSHSKAYFRAIHGIILTYDITNRKTFDNV